MERSNFALISALYSNKNAGLYNDIYFPMAKYAIVSLFYSKSQEYYDLADVQEFIQEYFGITIPLIVIKRCVQKFERDRDINLTLYESGEKFQIKRAWDVSINAEIEQRCTRFDESISILEDEYAGYKKREGLEDQKTFLEFITDNCEDILGYFEKNDSSRVDEQYTIMVYFLEYLNKNNNDLFLVANELFWGSVVAGFLKRSAPELESARGKEAQEFYLDTPLMMALLDLSTTESAAYAHELADIITASGGCMRVHPITLREITNILLSVESLGVPRYNTDIFAAYERRKLNPAKLAGIRAELPRLVDKLMVSVMPAPSERDVNAIIEQYRDKPVVKDLCSKRGRSEYTDDLFRDVHDIYMDDFIRNRRQKKGNTVFFVTLNTDLIRFCTLRNKEPEHGMIHPSKVVLEQWMHNSHNSTLQNNVLTETMARCLVMNERDVRRKLNVVAQHYNDSQQDFNPEAYRAVVLSLYRRDKDVIRHIGDAESSNGNVEQLHREMAIMAENALQKERNNAHRFADMEQRFADQEILLQKLQSQLSKTQEEKLEFSTQLANSRDEKEAQIRLYREKDELVKQLREKERNRDMLLRQRERKLSMEGYYLRIAWPWIVLFAAVGAIIYLFYISEATAAIVVTICTSALGLIGHNLFNSRQIKYEERKKQEEIWDSDHSELGDLNGEIESIEANIRQITKRIESV